VFLTDADYGLSPGGLGPLLSRIPGGITGASKAGQDYSELGVFGLDDIADFSGRAVASLVELEVTDTVYLSASEEPIGSNEIATTDTARLSSTETSALFNNIAATDTARLSVSDTVSLLLSNVTLKTASDTASLSATDTASIDATVTATDTASLSSSEVSAVAVTTEQKEATDTATLTVTEEQFLTIFSGVVEISATDDCLLSSTETARQVEVERVRRILMDITYPRIEIEIT
jgi:hypothetical protein